MSSRSCNGFLSKKSSTSAKSGAVSYSFSSKVIVSVSASSLARASSSVAAVGGGKRSGRSGLLPAPPGLPIVGVDPKVERNVGDSVGALVLVILKPPILTGEIVGALVGSIDTEGKVVGWDDKDGSCDGNADGCCESDGLRVGADEGGVDGTIDG